MLRKFLILSVFLLTLPAQISLATPNITDLKVILQRGGYSKATVSFTLSNFTIPTDLTTYGMTKETTEDAALALTRYMDVCIFTAAQKGTKCVDGNDPKKVQYLNNTTADVTIEAYRRTDFGISFASGSPAFVNDTTDTTGVSRRVEVTFDIIASGAAKFSTDTDIAIRLPLTTVTNPSNFLDADAVATLAVATTEVATATIRPSKGTLTAVWDKAEALDRDGGGSSVSDGAIGIAIPEDQWATIQIPMHEYNKANPDSEAVAAGKCHIEGDSDSCELVCDGYDHNNISADPRHYLKADDLTAAGIAFTSTGNTGSLSINSLTAGTNYAFIFQSQPDGLRRSCFVATPSDAITLTQLGGGPEPKVKDPRCFIATAAYGSALDPHLDTLRWFRDHFLMVTRVGNAMVQTYYRYSPPLADFISAHPTLRAITRGVLWLPVIMIETWRERPSLLLTLSAMSGTFLLLFLRRRSLRASI